MLLANLEWLQTNPGCGWFLRLALGESELGVCKLITALWPLHSENCPVLRLCAVIDARSCPPSQGAHQAPSPFPAWQHLGLPLHTEK